MWVLGPLIVLALRVETLTTGSNSQHLSTLSGHVSAEGNFDLKYFQQNLIDWGVEERKLRFDILLCEGNLEHIETSQERRKEVLNYMNTLLSVTAWMEDACKPVDTVEYKKAQELDYDSIQKIQLEDDEKIFLLVAFCSEIQDAEKLKMLLLDGIEQPYLTKYVKKSCASEHYVSFITDFEKNLQLPSLEIGSEESSSDNNDQDALEFPLVKEHWDETTATVKRFTSGSWSRKDCIVTMSNLRLLHCMQKKEKASQMDVEQLYLANSWLRVWKYGLEEMKARIEAEPEWHGNFKYLYREEYEAWDSELNSGTYEAWTSSCFAEEDFFTGFGVKDAEMEKLETTYGIVKWKILALNEILKTKIKMSVGSKR